MTDAAIAEHIVYLVQEYDKDIEQRYQAASHTAQMRSLAISADIYIDPTDYKLGPTEDLSVVLLDRIQATLENRSKDEN